VSKLEFTGERFVPGVRGEIWIEHWHRYHFASRAVAGKRVLDVACGEGYGTALLAQGAAEVTGVDLSEAAIEHARAAYAAARNARFVCAPCTRLPLADACIDVAVSFETIEHIADQGPFLDELARCLAPGGVVILSCPNKAEYSDKHGFANAFHVKELYRDELAQLVAARFPAIAWYGQKPTFFSVIAPEGEAARGQLVEVDEDDPSKAAQRLSDPLYFVLVAGRDRASVDRVAPALSVMADRGDWVHRDYEKVMKWMEQSVARAEALEKKLAARDEELAALRDEAAQRRGWTWWLKLPLIRLGLLK
jgi:ubiquinone/menaquinone biosynthesis C-methylase UbiE